VIVPLTTARKRNLGFFSRPSERGRWRDVAGRGRGLAAAAAVSLLVGGIGIMNLMLVPVSERRQEIGLRMAIGARCSEIGLQFLIEAGLLALLGSGAGVVLALGAAVAFGAASAIRNPATGVAILAAVAAATLITLISALFPARKAARLDPADALAQD
jgi:ABC-type antimicrobial peptide transport system permease subunit